MRAFRLSLQPSTMNAAKQRTNAPAKQPAATSKWNGMEVAQATSAYRPVTIRPPATAQTCLVRSQSALPWISRTNHRQGGTLSPSSNEAPSSWAHTKRPGCQPGASPFRKSILRSELGGGWRPRFVAGCTNDTAEETVTIAPAHVMTLGPGTVRTSANRTLEASMTKRQRSVRLRPVIRLLRRRRVTISEWQCKCERCGHSWKSLGAEPPARCANCKAPNWQHPARSYRRRPRS